MLTAHGWAFEATNGWAPRVYLWGDRAVRPLTTMVICVSEAGRRVGLAARTCSPERTTVIPYAVNLHDAPERVARGSGTVEVVSVGRLAEQKDFATMIAAFARLPAGSDARLRILGEGRCVPRSKPRSRSLRSYPARVPRRRGRRRPPFSPSRTSLPSRAGGRECRCRFSRR